jgi:hypothetical protein
MRNAQSSVVHFYACKGAHTLSPVREREERERERERDRERERERKREM